MAMMRRKQHENLGRQKSKIKEKKSRTKFTIKTFQNRERLFICIVLKSKKFMKKQFLLFLRLLDVNQETI